jgi:coenzyme F420 hydrogenase subunit beta
MNLPTESKMSTRSNFSSVKDVVNRHLCTQCGACVSACPVEAIEMREKPSGLLLPFVIDERCTACEECWRICSGRSIELNLPEHIDPFRGEVLGAYIGHAIDEEVRSAGQSGGVAGALLLFLLETGQVDVALTAAMPSDRSLRPKTILARSRHEILSAQGSKYCPIGINAALREVAADANVAAVGISCHIHGLHKLILEQNPMSANVRFKIGLFCDRTQLFTSIDMMSENAGLKKKDILALKYRSKVRSGYPGEVCFQMASGEDSFFPSSLRIDLKDYFTPPRCRLCFDKTNIFSDISIGDAWGISNIDKKGESVVIARNPKGANLLEEACRKGFLDLKPLDAEAIFKGQEIDQRRAHFAAYSDIWRLMGNIMPEYKGLSQSGPITVDSVEKELLQQKLLFSFRMAETRTNRAALALARSKQRREKFRFYLAKLAGYLKRLLNK